MQRCLDGLRFRPLADGEVSPVQAVFDGMSAESRRMRFFAAVPRLTSTMRRMLTAVDGDRRVALVAELDGEPVGIARYVRDVEDPSRAELALAVVDAHQGRGIGGAMLCELSQRAACASVRRLVFSVHGENRRMLALLRDLGAAIRRVDGLYEGALLLENTRSTVPSTRKGAIRTPPRNTLTPPVVAARMPSMSALRTRLGIAWLALAAPAGVVGFLLTRLSDHGDERRLGDLLVVLAALSAVLGVALVRLPTPGLRRASLALSVLWVGTAVAVVVVAQFLADQLWGGGVTLLVAVVTAVLALTYREQR